MPSTVPPLALLVAPTSWRTVDFISDLHLHAEDEATFLAGQQYLSHTPADAVFILGDLFETWVGDDAALSTPSTSSAAESFEARCAKLLRSAAQRTALFFMHGNRDFLVGTDFLQHCQTQLLQDPTVLEFADQRWLLTHGDALCLADTDYMQFRLQVRNPAWQQEFLALPLAQRRQIAREMRQQSKQVQRAAESYADVDAAAARSWLAAAQAKVMIHGHTHRPAVHDLGQGLRRWVLSDWDCSGPTPRAQVLRLQSANGLATVQRIALASI
jgi:UDP-2,3-diacylglucosamine hydrolase